MTSSIAPDYHEAQSAAPDPRAGAWRPRHHPVPRHHGISGRGAARSRRCCRAMPPAAPGCAQIALARGLRHPSAEQSARAAPSAEAWTSAKTHAADWQRHWIAEGFDGAGTGTGRAAAGRFCHGDTPTMADCCLVPQMTNARRVDLDLSPYPTLLAIEQACYAACRPSPMRGPKTSPMPNKTLDLDHFHALSPVGGDQPCLIGHRAALFRPLRPDHSRMAGDGGAGPDARPVGARSGRRAPPWTRCRSAAPWPRCWRPSA